MAAKEGAGRGAGRAPKQGPHRSAKVRLVVALVVGAVAGVLGSIAGSGILAVVTAWIAIAVTYSATTWFTVRHLSPEEVRDHATEDEAGRALVYVALNLTSLFSLVGVGVLLTAGSGIGGAIPVEAIVGVAAVASSWTLVHVIYMLRYAALYYADPAVRPIDFGDDDPDYQDFAYLAFTLGMTYQVSDTTLRTRAVRREVLRHSLLSYLFGAVVIASTINLVVQLASAPGGGQGGG